MEEEGMGLVVLREEMRDVEAAKELESDKQGLVEKMAREFKPRIVLTPIDRLFICLASQFVEWSRVS